VPAKGRLVSSPYSKTFFVQFGLRAMWTLNKLHMALASFLLIGDVMSMTKFPVLLAFAVKHNTTASLAMSLQSGLGESAKYLLMLAWMFHGLTPF
jgi:hypothetical protein